MTVLITHANPTNFLTLFFIFLSFHLKSYTVKLGYNEQNKLIGLV